MKMFLKTAKLKKWLTCATIVTLLGKYFANQWLLPLLFSVLDWTNHQLTNISRIKISSCLTSVSFFNNYCVQIQNLFPHAAFFVQKWTTLDNACYKPMVMLSISVWNAHTVLHKVGNTCNGYSRLALQYGTVFFSGFHGFQKCCTVISYCTF